MSKTVQSFVRLPGSRTPIPVPFPAISPLTARDAINYLAQSLKIREPNRYSLVISPSDRNSQGFIIPDGTHIKDLKGFNVAEDVLEFWQEPKLVKVGIYDGSSALKETKVIPLDFSCSLIHMIPVIQKVFPQIVGKEEFSFQHATSIDEVEKKFTKARPLDSADTLSLQNVGESDWILVSPLTVYEKLPSGQILVPDKEGWLIKQSVTNKRTSKQQKRWFILKDFHLYYYNNKGDSAPKGVLALNYWTITTPTHPAAQKKSANSDFILKRSYDGFVSKRGEIYQLFGPEHDIRGWFDLIRPRCYNSGKHKIFGVELREVLSRAMHTGNSAPTLVYRALAFLEGHMEQEGLFRVPGSSSHIEYLKDQFDQGNEPDLNEMDPHTVASVLKLYLRELPSPVFAAHLHDSIVALAPKRDSKKYADVLSELPDDNYRLLKMLATFLAKVAANHTSNKMGSANLAVVMAPNLFKVPTDEDMKVIILQTPSMNSVVEYIISHSGEIFKEVEIKAPSKGTSNRSRLMTSGNQGPRVMAGSARNMAPKSDATSAEQGNESGLIIGSRSSPASSPQVGFLPQTPPTSGFLSPRNNEPQYDEPISPRDNSTESYEGATYNSASDDTINELRAMIEVERKARLEMQTMLETEQLARQDLEQKFEAEQKFRTDLEMKVEKIERILIELSTRIKQQGNTPAASGNAAPHTADRTSPHAPHTPSPRQLPTPNMLPPNLPPPPTPSAASLPPPIISPTSQRFAGSARQPQQHQ